MNNSIACSISLLQNSSSQTIEKMAPFLPRQFWRIAKKIVTDHFLYPMPITELKIMQIGEKVKNRQILAPRQNLVNQNTVYTF